jgi:hypothetical protein
VSFLLEFDLGTEHLSVLAGKLDGYALLASVLAEAGQAAPPLLFCFGSPRREQGARRALAACRDSAAVRVATTAIDPYLTRPGRAGLAASDRPPRPPGPPYRPGRGRRAARPVAGLPGTAGT